MSNDNNDFIIHEMWRKINSDESFAKILNPTFYEIIKNIPTSDNFVFNKINNFNAQNNLCDFKYFLEKDVLVKSDRSSMANSLELRSPFLDIKILEYLSQIRFEDRFDVFNRKKLIKSIASDYLPSKILNQKKRGFNSPVSHWFTDIYYDMFNDYLNSKKSKDFFNTEAIKDLLIENKRKKVDNGNVLFNIFCFLIWINKNTYSL